MIKVVSLHKKRLPKGAIYVGRRTPQLKGSVLANPFRLEKEEDRPKVLAQYEFWLNARLVSPESPQSIELNYLVELARVGDLVLACWCFPNDCHADIIKARIEERLGHTTVCLACGAPSMRYLGVSSEDGNAINQCRACKKVWHKGQETVV